MELRSEKSAFSPLQQSSNKPNQPTNRNTTEIASDSPSPGISSLPKKKGGTGKLTQLTISQSHAKVIKKGAHSLPTSPSQDDSIIPPGQKLANDTLPDTPNSQEMIDILKNQCEMSNPTTIQPMGDEYVDAPDMPSGNEEPVSKDNPHDNASPKDISNFDSTIKNVSHIVKTSTQIQSPAQGPGNSKANDNGLLQVPSPTKAPYAFSFSGASASEGGLATKSQQVPDVDPNQFLTDIIIQRTKEIENDQRERMAVPAPTEIPIHDIKSHQILDLKVTPFTHEGALPPFEHGNIVLHYFITLRTILDKCTRAQLQNTFIKECLVKRIIPKGFKLNKPLMAVDPSPKLRLAHYKITTQAETKLMMAIVDHYVTTIPKLINEFTEYFEEIVEITNPQDKRLLVLKLMHYKNDLIDSRTKSQSHKLERSSNKYIDNGNSAARYNNEQPSFDPRQNRGRPQYHDDPGPSYRQNRNPSPNYRGTRSARGGQSWQRGTGPNTTPRSQVSTTNQDEWDDYTVEDEEYPNERRGGYNGPPPKDQRQPRQRGNQRFRKGGARF